MDIEFIQGDAIEQMQQLGDKRFAAIITSPPYNLGVNQGKSGKGGVRSAGRWAPDYADALAPDDYVAYHRRALELMLSLLQPDGLLWYVHRRPSVAKPLPIQGRGLLDRVLDGMPIRSEIIWDKGSPGAGFCAAGIDGGAYYPTPSYESIFLIVPGGGLLHRRQAGKGNVWRIPRAQFAMHPAAFPVELAQRALQSTLAQGAVLDPFCGSGSVGVASYNEGRDFIGIDISAEYCGIAKGRIGVLKVGKLL